MDGHGYLVLINCNEGTLKAEEATDISINNPVILRLQRLLSKFEQLTLN
jgi:hypothetical protein